MKLFPSSGKLPADTSIPEGQLVMYENDGAAILALVLAFKKQKYVVLNDRGREVELQAQRLYLLPGMAAEKLATTKDKTDYLQKILQAAKSSISTIDINSIWEAINSETKEFTTLELEELYFGKSLLNNHLALRLLLIEDRLFFKREKNNFIPRSKDVVEELKKALEAKQAKEQIAALTLGNFRERIKNPELPFTPQTLEIVHLLEDLAAGAELGPHRSHEAKDFIELAEKELDMQPRGSHENRAFNLLYTIGHFKRDQNLAFIRHKPKLYYDPLCIEEAEKLPKFSSISDFPDTPIRLDLTALNCFTVDDISTKDMDDALSLECNADGGYRLGIHISDVAALIPVGGALDREARSRATSIYAPELTVNMLPELLSQNRISLIHAEPRAVLSMIFELSPTLEVISTRITPAVINVKRRLTYDLVDDLLEKEDHDLSIIYQIACSQEEQRLRKGALKVHKRDNAVTVLEDGTVKLTELDENSPARSTIAEMMVMGNTAIANFAVANNIPLLFRGQEQPDEDVGMVHGIPSGPALDFAMRQGLKRSTTSTTPLPHSGLGLKAYAQATSPIRRYADLCNQRQILYFLHRGAPCYTAEELLQISHELDDPLNIANAVNKESKRFWLMVYLKQKLEHSGSKTTIEATVTRIDLRNPMLELDEVYFQSMVNIQGKLKLGDRVTLRIVNVEPRDNYIKLEKI